MRTTRPRHRAALAALPIAIIAAGCGASKTATTTSQTHHPPPPATLAAVRKALRAPEPRASNRTFTLALRGNAEPTGGAAATGAATLTLSAAKHRVCWTFRAMTGLDTPTAAHIQLGAARTDGPVIVPLGAIYRRHGCQPTPTNAIAAIEHHPRNYYINLGSRKHPNGAIRAQL
jgi:hypothetical protein